MGREYKRFEKIGDVICVSDAKRGERSVLPSEYKVRRTRATYTTKTGWISLTGYVFDNKKRQTVDIVEVAYDSFRHTFTLRDVITDMPYIKAIEHICESSN